MTLRRIRLVVSVVATMFILVGASPAGASGSALTTGVVEIQTRYGAVGGGFAEQPRCAIEDELRWPQLRLSRDAPGMNRTCARGLGNRVHSVIVIGWLS